MLPALGLGPWPPGGLAESEAGKEFTRVGGEEGEKMCFDLLRRRCMALTGM